MIAECGLPPGRIADRICAWPGDLFSRGASVPLRLAGALHGPVIDGRDPALRRDYPPHDADDLALWQAVSGALYEREGRLLARLDSAPQTNEVGRATAQTATAGWPTAQYNLPIVLSELARAQVRTCSSTGSVWCFRGGHSARPMRSCRQGPTRRVHVQTRRHRQSRIAPASTSGRLTPRRTGDDFCPISGRIRPNG